MIVDVLVEQSMFLQAKLCQTCFTIATSFVRFAEFLNNFLQRWRERIRRRPSWKLCVLHHDSAKDHPTIQPSDQGRSSCGRFNRETKGRPETEIETEIETETETKQRQEQLITTRSRDTTICLWRIGGRVIDYPFPTIWNLEDNK